MPTINLNYVTKFNPNLEKFFLIRPFLIAMAHTIHPQLSIEYLEKVAKKFFSMVDNECGLPSIISHKSFMKSTVNFDFRIAYLEVNVRFYQIHYLIL